MSAASGELAGELLGLLPEAKIVSGFGQSGVRVPVSRWHAAAVLAREELGCVLFDWLGAEDAGRPGQSGQRHGIVLHAVNPVRRLGVLLETEIWDEPLPSVADVWAGAAWHEREAAEMFGITVDGHPGPDRLLLSDSFAGHPLRKDFVLAARVVRPWPGGLEPGEATAAPSRRRLAPPGVPDPEWGPRREPA